MSPPAIDILPKTLAILDSTYQHTSYEDKQDAEDTFELLKNEIAIATKSTAGQTFIQKFFFLANTISTEGNFNDMVKVAWRMVKETDCEPLRKISLFFISIGTMCTSLPKTDAWRNRLESWLGKQLTIGGKGCTGQGEGTVMDRMRRFLSTPYLHDFD